MARPRDSLKICCAATYFARESQNLSEIAVTLQISERTIQRWSETAPEWEETLSIWGYTGDRSFEMKPKRDTKRDTGDLFYKARKIYQEALLSGAPRHKLAGITAEKVGDDKLTARRIRDWARVHEWHNLPEQDDPVMIYCAAAHFAFASRDLTQIATTFKVSEGTIRVWQTEYPEWTKALTVCRYNGNNTFEDGSENQEKDIELAKIHGAAALSEYLTKDFKRIADIYNVSAAEIQHWATQCPEWQTSLDACKGIDFTKIYKRPDHKKERKKENAIQVQKRRNNSGQSTKIGEQQRDNTRSPQQLGLFHEFYSDGPTVAAREPGRRQPGK